MAHSKMLESRDAGKRSRWKAGKELIADREKDKGERIKGKINSTTESHGKARSGIFVNKPSLSAYIQTK